MTLSDFSIKRPVFAWMLMLGLMAFGLISFFRLGIGRLPDVDFPVANVRVQWEGASPEVMESDVVDIIEESLTAVQGIREISSTVRQGDANITIELELERDIDVAVQEIQTKLAQAQRRLPDDMDPPIVSKTNPEDQPIMWITVTADEGVPLRTIMEYIQTQLQDRFTTISGVGEVFMGGFLERNLRVWIDQNKLNEYQLTVLDVVSAIEQGHVERPAGRIETETTERNVRAMGEALNVQEFENIPITRRGGSPIYVPIAIKDVAQVEDGLADVRRISRAGGKQTVGLGIRKQRGVNEVAVGERVLARLAEVQKETPPGIQLNLNVDRTKFVKEAINELKMTLLLSAMVTSIVCWLFLGSWTSTVNVLLAIPTSILGTFIFIHFLGFTLNTFTMLALSLAIGIVVDDAIMVLENIVRHREKGEAREEAAHSGANQIAFAAMATTASIIAIFLPVAFMTGIIGKYFFQFGIVMSVAVALSLLEALTLTPMRCSQFLEVEERQTKLGRAVENGFRGLAVWYHRRLTWTLGRRWSVVIVSSVIYLASMFLINFIRKEPLPAQDQSMLFVRAETPVGSSIDFTNEKFKQIEAFIMSRPEVARYFSAIGGFGGGEVNSGQVFVVLKEPHDRPVTPPYKKRPGHEDVMDVLRKELNKIPDVKVRVQDPSLSGLSAQRGFPVEMTLLGPDWQKLIEYSGKIQEKMAQSPLLVDVDSNFEEGVSEIQVFPDRQKARERGVNIEAIASTINAMIAGERVGQYTQNGRRYDVRVRLIPSQRTQADDIKDLWVWNNHGEMVQLKDVVMIKENPTSLTITRRNRERSIDVHSNVAKGKSQADAVVAAQRIAEEILPEGYHASFGGNTKTFKESFSSLTFVLWLGILVAYMILASQFNTYKDPFIILLALPFSVSGAFMALRLTDQSLNIYSFIGLILLMGIVKKNSILLVEFTNQLRAQGRNVNEALLEACPIRLRPILMTSLSTIAAALPPAFSLGAGSEALRPMAITVIGGMIVSTFFTLFVIPAVYSLMARLEWKKKHHPADVVVAVKERP